MWDTIPADVFDCETDGLLDELTKLTSLVIFDEATKELLTYADDPRAGLPPIEVGVRKLMASPHIVGHNIIGFDLKAIKKVYPWFKLRDDCIVEDTLVECRLIWSDIKDEDFTLNKEGKLPANLIGTHKLKAWGFRLGYYKDEIETDWKEWSPELLEYNIKDVRVTARLLKLIRQQNYSHEAIVLEHEVAWLMDQQETNGFCFDVKKAEALVVQLRQDLLEITEKLREIFPMRLIDKPFIPKRDNVKKGYKAGVKFIKKVPQIFNPGSRAQVASRLKERFGWEPVKFTPAGAAAVDEDVLENLPWPEVKPLAQYYQILKLLGQLADGDNAWMKYEKKGKVHGRVNANGAVTGRATHSSPNMSQVPSNRSFRGDEARSLWTVPPGWKLVGCDASGLELRCLGHFMAKYDGGAYIDLVLNGDVHWENVQALGLIPPGTKRDKHDPKHELARANAKTFIYAFIYGAGDEKIGLIVAGPTAEASKKKSTGKKMKKAFEANLPAFGKLKKAVMSKVEKTNTLTGLDGRILKVRKKHAALNTLLQSAGALLCKKWIVLTNQELQAHGYKHGWDGDYCYCVWSHDEIQIAARAEIAEQVGQIAQACVPKAGAYFNFRCPLAGEYKIGNNWAETH